MKTAKILAAIAATSLMAAPVFAASANPAAGLSLAGAAKSARVATVSGKKSRAASTGLIIGLVGTVGLVGLLIGTTAGTTVSRPASR